ncbi:MAG: F0F1 ATP synthase subunit epsilon [Gammaproteobacteria bacterium]|nr:F0F1 ATP synthase subunit epsilon [Gammaproteobacteria bacterium]MBU2435958.1 F0F1 ATP synthase subunit epsilon [Gammaproteobacteria bacterium]MBU2449260.1 F0F1 ATP synthase subunit epsilon [Gammaproteobacteria bacterium]
MKTFALILLDSAGAERFEHVRQFVGADGSGAFGILGGHESMVVALRYGLARFEDAGGAWHYIALPGGILRFKGNTLSVVAVRYFLGDEPGVLVERLAAELARDDSELGAARQTLAKIDRSLIRRLADMAGHGGMVQEGLGS